MKTTTVHLGGIGLVCMAVMTSGCGPSEEKKAALAEQRRIECLDKICPGDVEPKRDALTEEAIKLNGQWFIGPKEYFSSGMNGAAFEWWNHEPLSRSMKRPPEAQALAAAGKGYDFSIEIHLRSNPSPQYNPGRYQHLLNAQNEGRVIERMLLRPGLEFWRTRETDGLGPGLWYVATQYTATDPNGAVLSCRQIDNPKYGRCVTAFEWRPGIFADMRFNARHASDWPLIYQEAVRVLQLLRKA